MKQEFIDLAKYRLEKAKNTLSYAKSFINDATLDSTVNRIYYAVFYAVNALLITQGLYASKHSGIRAIFNREIVNKGLIEKQYSSFKFIRTCFRFPQIYSDNFLLFLLT